MDNELDLKSGTKHYWHNMDTVKLLGKLTVCQLVRKLSNFYENFTVYDRVQKSPQIKHMHPAHSFQPHFLDPL
jgi:hypothetical protein